MQTVSAAVIGASGYSGLELTRLVARHPRLRLTALTSGRWSGETAGTRLPLPAGAAALAYRPLSESDGVDAEVAFLATPAEVSHLLAPRLLARGLRVVDLSGAFRLADAAAYPGWYGFAHQHPALLAEARYGLPELARARLAGARLVTNPGCYATAIALAVAPLVKSGLCSASGIAVTGLSGVSGAGRKASEDYSFCEVDEDLRAYRLGQHQHVPEIEQTVARYAGACGGLSFTPVLVPVRRGILASCVLRLTGKPSAEALAEAMASAYAEEPFVRTMAAEKVMVKDVARTNRAHVGVALDARAGVAVAVSAIDNLVKGAAGQAVQALNAALGWPEATGLDLLGGLIVKIPRGFRYGGVACGLKPARRDLALIVSDVPAAGAGVFTVNRAAAAPVIDARERVPAEGIRAVVANSGNANALTGPGGLDDVAVIRGAAADLLGVQKRAVLTVSTGVIGVRLPAMKVVTALPGLVELLGDHADHAAEAIMTTDTRRKLASRELVLGGKTATIACIAKGSGMLAPQLATTLAIVTTDAAVAPRTLQEVLVRAVHQTFNMLTVDGEMSTNDTVLVLANGLAGNPRLAEPSPDLELFEAALTDLLGELARAMAADGEGATKLCEVVVSGAPSEAAARDVARAIAHSPLVKASLFGADPNWGRVLATVGSRAGSQGWPIDPYKARVSMQGVMVFTGGAPTAFDTEALRLRLREPRVDVRVELADGQARATAWGCDLSYDYVKINADYTSMIVQTPDGMMAKDDRVANYSPAFKRTLLVEALKYIGHFSGQIAVVKYGGAAMVKDSLKVAFAEDIALLKKVGLKPVVIHGGALEVTRTLEKLGERSEFIDGMRVTDAASLPVVEMVLTGKVNQELVSLLNARNANAVGLSGKDGTLLRAEKRGLESGVDLGFVGRIVEVNRQFLQMFLDGGYIPVISPIGIAEDGTGLSINADEVASAVAASLGAKKLIYLTDVPGLLESAPDGALIRQITVPELRRRVEAGAITGGMKWKAEAIEAALAGGVERVHVLDGRQPHTVIAELFTDRGVGTLVTAS